MAAGASPHEQLAAFAAIAIPSRAAARVPLHRHPPLDPGMREGRDRRPPIRADLLAASTAIACERFRMLNRRWPEHRLERSPRTFLRPALDPLPDPLLATAVSRTGSPFTLSARARRPSAGGWRRTSPCAAGVGLRLWESGDSPAAAACRGRSRTTRGVASQMN